MKNHTRLPFAFQCPGGLPLAGWLVLLCCLLTLTACRAPSPPPEVRAIFVRSGLVLEGLPVSEDSSAKPPPVRLLRDGTALPFEDLELDGGRRLLGFSYAAGDRLEVEVGGRYLALSAPARPSPYLLRTIPLPGDAASAASSILDSTVAFSPDGSSLAVGTLFGDLHLVEVLSGVTRWTRRAPEGMIKRVAFSPDGTQIYAGEQSPDGMLYAIDSQSGAINWKVRLADELEGSHPPDRSNRYAVYFLPGVFDLRVTQDGRIVVAGTHSWSAEGIQKNRSRLYVFGPEGARLWAFPEEGPLDGNVITFGMDPAGTRLVFSFSRSATTPPTGRLTRPGVYALDLLEKQLRWGHHFEPLTPHFKEVFVWEAVSITPDADRAIVGLGDGRAALFALDVPGPENQPLELLDLGVPVEVSGVPIATPISYTAAAPGVLFAQTNNSNIPFGTEATSRTPPAPHPAACTLFALEPDGSYRWRYQSRLTPSGIWPSRDGRLLLMTTANTSFDTRTDQHGLLLLEAPPAGSAQVPTPIFSYGTEGPVFFHAAMSADGRWLAGVESPAQHPSDQRPYGSYQVHLIH